jgi:hypothetical protein
MTNQNRSLMTTAGQKLPYRIRMLVQTRLLLSGPGAAKSGTIQCHQIRSQKRVLELLAENCSGCRGAVNEDDVPIGASLTQLVKMQPVPGGTGDGS